MKELEVEIRIRNNRLLERRRQLGLTQRELSNLAGVSLASYAAFELMERSPIQTNAPRGPLRQPRWHKTALRLADFYECALEELFPGVTMAGIPSVARRKFNADELHLLGTGEATMAMLESPENAVIRRELHEAVTGVLQTISDREREILVRRFGLDGSGGSTLREVGETLHKLDNHGRDTEKIGIGVENTRQSEKKALRKLRHPSRSKKLRAFIA